MLSTKRSPRCCRCSNANLPSSLVAASLVIGILLSAVLIRFLKLPPYDFLFVLHDAGESLCVKDALNNLAKDSSFRIAVLALGEPAVSIFTGMPNVHTPRDLGVRMPIADGSDRNATLSDVDVALLLGYFGRPSVIVAGMAYSMQAQLAAAFRSSSPREHEMICYAVGLDDAIGGRWRDGSLLVSDFLGTHPVLDELFVADRQTFQNATAYIDAHFGGRVAVTLTGSGTLGEWRDAAHNKTTIERARSAMVRVSEDFCPGALEPCCCSRRCGRCAQLGASHSPVWPPSTEIVVFAGGYGGGDYVQALYLFCRAVTRLREPASNLRFVFSPHPGYPSSRERLLFEQWGCLDDGANLKVVDPHTWGGLTTAQLVSAAQASMSKGSTVGGQSLAIGVPHVYISAVARVDVRPYTPRSEKYAQRTRAHRF